MAWYDKWAIMAIAAAICVAGYNGIPWCKMGIAEWAYWVGGIGSISAIAGSFAIARYQAKETNKIRRLEVLETRHILSQMALRLAIDTVLCLMDTSEKIEGRMQKPREIGHERLAQLQTSLQSFANKNIPAEILSELLVLQREVAFTQMAIREIGKMRPTEIRLGKAYKRTSRVIRAREAIRKISQSHKSEYFAAIG